VAYAVGLATAIAVARYFHSAQPALLYLVPAVLGALAWHARREGLWPQVWSGSLLEEAEGDLEAGAARLLDPDAGRKPTLALANGSLSASAGLRV
jgi:hypothetical protein